MDKPRHKTRGSGWTEGTCGVYTGNPPTYQYDETFNVSYEFERIQGWNLANYHLRKKRKELLPLTPFTQYIGSGEISGNAGYTKIDGNGAYRSPHYYIFPEFLDGGDLPWFVTEAECRAVCRNYPADKYVQAAAAKIYSSSFDALTFAAELSKTVALFKRIVRRLLSYIRSGQIEKIWLELRYGWRLLVYDIQEVNELLTNLDEHRKRYKERQGMSHSWSEMYESSHDWTSQSFDLVGVTNYTLSVRGTVIADIEIPKAQFNPVTTAWELVPWSFVVDWVVSVGKFLESMSFLVLAQQYYAAGGYHLIVNRTVQCQNVVGKPQYTGLNSQLGTFTATYTRRVPTSVSSNPHLHLRLDALKVLDLVALVLQAIRR